MKELEVTDEQYAYLDGLRDELQELVGRYGHVRMREAVQYMIDTHAPVTAGAPDARPPSAGPGRDAVGGRAGPDADANEDGEGDDEAQQDDGGQDPVGSDVGDEDRAGEGAADDGDRLSAMMNLLETHREKWGETPAEGGRYEVELPDGELEVVQTRDDVRAVLFRNYR